MKEKTASRQTCAWRIMLQALLLCLVAFPAPAAASSLPVVEPSKAGMSAERLQQLDRVVKEAIEAREIPGAVVLVSRRGQIVYRKAFGLRASTPSREAMTVDTIFDMASMTKVMATATSAMILLEEGRLSLADPVSRHLPEFSVHGKEPITILQLLTHFSGLRPDIDLDEDWSGYQTAIERGFAEKLVAVPGERFIYSDINYFILGEIIRKVSGQPLDQFSSERIFQPLGMTSTGFNPSDELRSRIAPTEWRQGKMLRGRVHDPTAERMAGVAGHAGLFSTAEDTARFAQAILDGGLFQNTRVLSPLAVKKMTSNQSPAGQDDWRGLGFDIRSRFSTTRGDLFLDDSFGHTGFTGTSFWIDPATQTAVILLTNRLHPNGSGSVTELRKKVASVAAAAILDAPWQPNQNH